MCKPKVKRIEQKVTLDINQHKKATHQPSRW